MSDAKKEYRATVHTTVIPHYASTELPESFEKAYNAEYRAEELNKMGLEVYVGEVRHRVVAFVVMVEVAPDSTITSTGRELTEEEYEELDAAERTTR